MSNSKIAKTTALFATALLGMSSMALADETTTTTTTHQERTEQPGVTVGVPGVVGVEVDKRPAEDCTTHKSTTTDEDTGTTVKRKTTNC